MAVQTNFIKMRTNIFDYKIFRIFLKININSYNLFTNSNNSITRTNFNLDYRHFFRKIIHLINNKKQGEINSQKYKSVSPHDTF